MRPVSFGLWHTSLVLALLLFPQAILIHANNISLQLSEAAGLVLMEVSVVIALELLALSISNLLTGRAQRLMQSSLAALLIPVAFILLTDYRFITSLGNHPTPDIIKYSLTDISIFISYVQSEMTVGVFLALLLTAIISIYLAY